MLSVAFDGSHTEKQWLPQRRIKAKTVREECIHVGILYCERFFYHEILSIFAKGATL